ncbi:MAG: NAD-dependent epimerase/dehydratase family protein [Nitrospinota bacterium]
MARVLVTGGAGFIGSHLCEAGLRVGEEVTAVDDLSTGSVRNLPHGVRLVQGDLREPGLSKALLDEFRPDVVYHLAAQSSVVRSLSDPSHDQEVNVGGTLALLEACRAAKKPPALVYASTGGASYGDPEKLPVSEEHPTEYRSPYGASKHVAEHYVSLYAKLFGLRTVSLRFANIYGPRQRGDLEAGVVSIFAQRLAEGSPIVLYGNGEATRDYVFVTDAVEALRLAARKGAPGEAYNVGTGIATRVEELLGLLARAMGVEPARVDRAPLRPGEIFRIALDSSRLNQATGWKPRYTLGEGVAAFAEWFRENHSSAGDP